MNKKQIDDLTARIDQSYVEQTELYQKILAQSIDPQAVAEHLRQLEAGVLKRWTLNRLLEDAIKKKPSIFEQYFG